jgi:glyoxylase-like metal-dependent hydrolase (beta-lactamase superfamily II)
MHLLCDGFFTLDKSFVVYMKYMGQPYDCTLKPLLILTSDKKILVDTGIGELPEKYQRLYTVRRSSEQNLETQLAHCGLKLEDIDVVVNTHLHFDHCGNNALFPNAKFVVQEDEFRFACEPERFQQSGYIRELFDLKLDYELVRGEHRVADDVLVVPTPGHSVGHQSVIVRDGDRNIVYCGDAAPIRENLERRNVPGVLYCAHRALESIDYLRSISDAVYIYPHDDEQLAL